MRFLCLLIWGGALLAQEAAVLSKGASVERDIQPGETHGYQVRLEAGQFAALTVDPKSGSVRVVALDPQGGRIRSFSSLTGKIYPAIAAEAEGSYRIDISVPKDERVAHYSITLTETLTFEEQASPKLKEAYVSTRIRALREQVQSGHRAALEHFWKDVAKEGTPIVEAFPPDKQYSLVTFVWRASAPTRNVLVDWAPFATAKPQDYMMAHLADTDVWYKTLKIRSGARFLYKLTPNVFQSGDSAADFFRRSATSVADPLNPKRRPLMASKYEAVSIAELPGAPPQPWSVIADVPRGKTVKHKFASSILKNERTIEIYTPPDYATEGKPYPVLIVFDQSAYTIGAQVPTPTILDNLIAGKRIAPMLAVLVDNVNQASRSNELPCNPKFADFLSIELMPWVRRSYNATSKPTDTYAAGSSFGGLASTCAALFHPELVGNVISQSGSYWWDVSWSENFQRDPNFTSPAPNWVARQFAERPKMPIRFWLDAGLFEVDLRGEGGAILEPNRHLRDVLKAKGYEVHHYEFVGGHDYLSWRGTLADGLIALAGTAP